MPGNAEDSIVGTTVHFTAGDVRVEVSIAEDTPTTRSFIEMLPMTMLFEDCAGMEKIAYPEQALDYAGSEDGIAPQIGDLFSHKPWADLDFFYEVDGLGRSADLVRIGTTDDLEAVMRLDDKQVTIIVAG